MDLSSYNRTPGFEQGLEARRRVLGEEYVGPSIARGAEDDFAHQLQQFVTEYCWGTVWCPRRPAGQDPQHHEPDHAGRPRAHA